MWDLSSLMRDGTHTPILGVRSLSHRTATQAPCMTFTVTLHFFQLNSIRFHLLCGGWRLAPDVLHGQRSPLCHSPHTGVRADLVLGRCETLTCAVPHSTAPLSDTPLLICGKPLYHLSSILTAGESLTHPDTSQVVTLTRYLLTQKKSARPCVLGDYSGGSVVKNPQAMQETRGQAPGWEDPLKEGMETHSSILAWRIPTPWTEEPRGFQRGGFND